MFNYLCKYINIYLNIYCIKLYKKNIKKYKK